MSNSAHPASGDPLLSAYSQRRRLSAGTPRSRSPSPLPHPSISSSPTPPPPPGTASSAAHPSSSLASALPSSILTAGASVQQAAGSFWRRANAFYQQATASPHEAPTHARRHSDAARLPPTPPSVSSPPLPPRHSSGVSSPVLNSTPSPNAPPTSSFLSSVLSSVSAAVSSVSLPSTSALTQSGFPSSTASSDELIEDPQPGGPEVAAFTELPVGSRSLQFPDAFLPAPTVTGPVTAGAAQAPTAFALGLSRMSLLSAVLSDDVGGFLSPSQFFPRSSWFAPSLRVSAVMQKLQALEAVHAQLVDVARLTKKTEVDTVGQPSSRLITDAVDALLSTCRKTQNELAFSLSSIKESTAAAGYKPAEAEPDRTIPADSAPAPNADSLPDGEAVAAPAESPAAAGAGSTVVSAAATVDRLSSRVKALGYSIAKTATRMSKQVLADRMSREQAELYIVFVQRIAVQLQNLLPTYTAARHSASQAAAAGGEGVVGWEGVEGADAVLVAKLDEVGQFVCDVLVVFIVDDMQRASLRYVAEQQENLLRGVLPPERRRSSPAQDNSSHSQPTTARQDSPSKPAQGDVSQSSEPAPLVSH